MQAHIRASAQAWPVSRVTSVNIFISRFSIGTLVPRLAEGGVSGMQKKILVKIKKDGSELSLREVLDKIKELQDQNPDEDVFFDGDEYAICARPRKAAP